MADVKLIRMRRSNPAHSDLPEFADVHPAEVEIWKVYGWEKIEPEVRQEKKRK